MPDSKEAAKANSGYRNVAECAADAERTRFFWRLVAGTLGAVAALLLVLCVVLALRGGRAAAPAPAAAPPQGY